MKYLLILLLLLFRLPSFSQRQVNNPVDDKLSLLVSLKSEYEEYRDRTEMTSHVNSANKYAYKRDSVYRLYMGMIKAVKKSPEVYLVHINKTIKTGKVEYDGAQRILYNYFNQSLSYLDWDLYFVPRLEAYKMIKRSLFEKKENQLPERTDLYIQRGGKDRIRFSVPPIDAKDTVKLKGDKGNR